MKNFINRALAAEKKLFTLLLAVAASVGTMFAQQVQIGDLYYYLDATNQTAEVTSQNSRYPYWSTTITTAIIPASVTYNSVTYSVTSIGWGAFSYCSGLTSVTIPNSVTSIGYEAFLGCSDLTSVTIPNSVTSIGVAAFSGCTVLTSVTIPNSVTSIGWGAFQYCSGLTSVTIGNSVTSIGDDAFYKCTGLTSVTIGNSVTSIGKEAFYYCSSLTGELVIPNSVTSIGSSAFAGCSGLTSLSVEAGNTVYDSRNNCNAIINTSTNTLIFGCQNTTIPNSVTSIGDYAFFGCSGLTSVTIPNSVTSIGNSAFDGCTVLTSVTIPNSVTSIGWCAFFMCTGLTSVTCFATTPPQLDYGVFGGVDKSIPLYVPAGSVSAYKSADQWKDFMNILPISQQGVEEVLSNQVPSTKILHNGQILILRGEKTYTLQGQEVK